MAVAVIMPRQGQSVESCILTAWYKGVGDTVSAGDLLFSYETDKASFEEEAKSDGILLARFYEEGDEVPVLINVAVIGSEGESAEEYRPDGASESTAVRPGVEDNPVEGNVEGTPVKTGYSVLEPTGSAEQVVHPAPGSDGKKAISPRARRLAREKRVVVDSITGTGPGGRIIERDILEEIKNGKRLTPLARKKVEGEGLTVPGAGNSPYGKITSKDLVEASQDSRAPLEVSAGEHYTDIPLTNVRRIIAGTMYRRMESTDTVIIQ